MRPAPRGRWRRCRPRRSHRRSSGWLCARAAQWPAAPPSGPRDRRLLFTPAAAALLTCHDRPVADTCSPSLPRAAGVVRRAAIPIPIRQTRARAPAGCGARGQFCKAPYPVSSTTKAQKPHGDRITVPGRCNTICGGSMANHTLSGTRVRGRPMEGCLPGFQTPWPRGNIRSESVELATA